jgi:hypothetical protein
MLSSQIVPPTEARVPLHSKAKWNKKIAQQAIDRLSSAATASRSQLTDRLKNLSKEWDMERTLEFNASIAGSVGILFSVMFSRYWLLLTTVVLLFLLQHAVQGWCPPMPVFRAYGFRTAEEIEDEANALKLLRGDFDVVGGGRGGGGGGSGGGQRQEEMVDAMTKNKQYKGTFLGPSSLKVAEE